MKYTFDVRYLEDGRGTVRCVGGISARDAESIVTHILLDGVCGNGMDPFVLLCSAMNRIYIALEREAKEPGTLKVSNEQFDAAQEDKK